MNDRLEQKRTPRLGRRVALGLALGAIAGLGLGVLAGGVALLASVGASLGTAASVLFMGTGEDGPIS